MGLEPTDSAAHQAPAVHRQYVAILKSLSQLQALTAGRRHCPLPHAGRLSAGDDGHALVWDLGNAAKPVEDPLLVYRGEGPINHISWSSLQPEWVRPLATPPCATLPFC